MVPAPHESDPLANDAALQAGPGSAKVSYGTRRTPHRSLTQLQWVVGCDGDVRAAFQSAVDRAEVTAKNGHMEKLLNTPVLGWHITQVSCSCSSSSSSSGSDCCSSSFKISSTVRIK